MEIRLSLVVFLLSCISSAIADETSSFEEIRAKSLRESRAPEAMDWEQKNAAQGGAKLTPIINACRLTAPDGKDKSFTLLVRLAKEGHPLNVLTSPRTPFAECARSGVANLTFANAPWEGYWLEIDMQP